MKAILAALAVSVAGCAAFPCYDANRSEATEARCAAQREGALSDLREQNRRRSEEPAPKTTTCETVPNYRGGYETVCR